MKTLKKLMMGALSLMLGMTIAACSSSNNLSSKNFSPAEKPLAEKVLGKWIISEIAGQPLPTNEKVVFTFAPDNKFYLTMSRTDNTSKYKKWDNRIPCAIKLDSNTFTITGSTDDGAIEAILTVNSITETEMQTITKFTIKAPDSTLTMTIPQRYVKTIDYSEEVLGLWEGRISSEQSVYDDHLEHRWEYKNDGSYVYYRHTDEGEWVSDVNKLSEYFVDGSLLCTRWEDNDGKEYREWWEIESIKDGVMNWTALRIGDDGKPFTATFSMTKVK